MNNFSPNTYHDFHWVPTPWGPTSKGWHSTWDLSYLNYLSLFTSFHRLYHLLTYYNMCMYLCVYVSQVSSMCSCRQTCSPRASQESEDEPQKGSKSERVLKKHRINIEKDLFYVNTISCLFHLSSWSGSNIRWGQAFRLRHLTTGHYLALTEDQGLILQDRGKSDTKSTAFSFRASKVRCDDMDLDLVPNLQVELWPEKKLGLNKVEFKMLSFIFWIECIEECVSWLKLEVLREKGVKGEWKALENKQTKMHRVAQRLLGNIAV